MTLMTSRSFHRICFIRRLLPLSKVITRDIVASNRMAEACGNQAVGKWSLHLLRNGEIVPFEVSLRDTPRPRRPKAATGGQNQTDNGNWKNGLAANGRGASK
jgi:hypothetical protein